MVTVTLAQLQEAVMISLEQYKTIRQTLLILLITYSCAFNILTAQWVQVNGPVGGRINCITSITNDFGDTLLFAGTACGLYKTSNNGINWVFLKTGLTNREILSLTSHKSLIFAGTKDSGLFLSSDFGGIWRQANLGSQRLSITALASDGINIFAGTRGNGMFLSSDNGTTWTLNNMNDITALCASRQYVVEGTVNDGVFVSSNQGKTWNNVSRDLPNRHIKSLAIYPNSSKGIHILAGNMSTAPTPSTSVGVYYSSNSGLNWSKATINTPNRELLAVSSVAIDGPNFYACIYGEGTFGSTDGGLSWRNINASLGHLVYTFGFTSMYVFAGTEQNGVFRSSNYGTDWEESNRGLQNRLTHSVFTTKNSATGTSIFAGIEYQSLQRTTNNGLTWERSDTGIPATNVYDFAQIDSCIFLGTELGVFRTTDGGNTWNALKNGLPVAAMYKLMVHESRLFAGSIDSRGIFVSSDYGEQWLVCNTGLPDHVVVLSLQSQGTTIVAGTRDHGVYISSNSGTSWSAINSGIKNKRINALIITGSTILVASPDGIFRTTNLGSYWTDANIGLPSTVIYSLFNANNNIFAGTKTGVYQSTDDGSSWIFISHELPTVEVRDILVDSNYLYLASWGIGVWKRSLSELTSAKIFIPRDPTGCILYQNYPNPFIFSTEIEFELSQHELVKLSISDHLGRTISTVVEGLTDAGRHSVRFDALQLPAGFYHCILRTPTQIRHRLMHVIR